MASAYRFSLQRGNLGRGLESPVSSAHVDPHTLGPSLITDRSSLGTAKYGIMIGRADRWLRSCRVVTAEIRFRMKTGLYRHTPGGYGYMRRLQSGSDPGYVHERDMHPVRKIHHGGAGWDESVDEDGLRRRAYSSYDEYVTHQRQKFDEVIKMQGGFSNETVAAWRWKYYRRFRGLLALLPPTAVIVCAGARQGTEVEVLRDLGFRNAYGIDLNPGPNNPYVREGDFHKLPQADRTVDLVYSNSLDHVYDFDRFFSDHARALKGDGYVLYELAQSVDDCAPFESVAWDDERVVIEKMLQHFARVVRVETESAWKWILLQGPRSAETPSLSGETSAKSSR